MSATDPTNRKGDESVLTGVGKPIVHRSKAEQIEEQAWEFTNIVQRFGFRVFMGGHTKAHQGNGQVGRKEAESSSEDLDTEEEEDVELVEMDKKENATKDLTEKQKKKLKAKEAKQKRDQMVGEMAKSAQDGLGDFADALERVHKFVPPSTTLSAANQILTSLRGTVVLCHLQEFILVRLDVRSSLEPFSFQFFSSRLSYLPTFGLSLGLSCLVSLSLDNRSSFVRQRSSFT